MARPIFTPRLRSPKACSPGPSRQRGASLLLAMLLVVFVMLLGMGALGAAWTQYHLAANQQFDNDAFNQAEHALGMAEQWLSTGTHFRDPGFAPDALQRSPGLYPLGLAAPAMTAPLSVAFTAANAVCVDGEAPCNSSYVIGLLAQDQRLVGASQAVGVPSSSGCHQVNLYQVIARGRGGRGASRTLASVYSVLSCTPI